MDSSSGESGGACQPAERGEHSLADDVRELDALLVVLRLPVLGEAPPQLGGLLTAADLREGVVVGVVIAMGGLDAGDVPWRVGQGTHRGHPLVVVDVALVARGQGLLQKARDAIQASVGDHHVLHLLGAGPPGGPEPAPGPRGVAGAAHARAQAARAGAQPLRPRVARRRLQPAVAEVAADAAVEPPPHGGLRSPRGCRVGPPDSTVDG
mmetsp:Transcript_74065/g.191059  ORF Transcript_74065/g.191059 Transcript_74065/m.191059 type:complete len:209 (-) Transcript_74065:170-796(-)